MEMDLITEYRTLTFLIDLTQCSIYFAYFEQTGEQTNFEFITWKTDGGNEMT